MRAAFGLVLLGLSLQCASPARAERMRSFETEIYLTAEDRFTVVERIAWDFEGAKRHGIFRDIPVAYGRGRSADYHIRLDVGRVTVDGADVPAARSRAGDSVRLRIGDPERLVTGVHTYEIRYAVSRGLLFFPGHDELYWNVNGTGWKVAVDRVTAAVYLPEDRGDALQLACFTGAAGSVERACTARAGPASAHFAAARALGPGENLSIVLGLPKGVIREPSASERFWSRVRDFLSPWMLLPILVGFGMLHLWRSLGRDPAGKDAIDVRYEPPEGMSPAELGTVVDERVHLVDITSTILDLAVRGHLRIEETETTKFLFLKDRDWELVRLEGRDALRGHERLLLDGLFHQGADRVAVSDLKYEFHDRLPGLRDAIYSQVSGRRSYFAAPPDRVRTRWAIGGGAVALLGAAVLGAQVVAAGLAILASGLVVLAFSPWMPRRTRRGRQAHQEILGFKEFLSRVDRDRLERMGTRTTDAFERILPFAIVLGVADEWAEAFADLYSAPPEWYASPRYRGGFRPTMFVSDIGTSLDAIGATIAATPPSSGSGGSGFGGGGFSGGGFGGGGGGSW